MLIIIFHCQDNLIMITITFVQTNNEKKVVSVEDSCNLTLLELAIQNDVEIIGACEGSCACGTCHVYIDEDHLKKIEKPKEDEENVLDIVFNVLPTSRLACQVVVSKELDGAIITIAG